MIEEDGLDHAHAYQGILKAAGTAHRKNLGRDNEVTLAEQILCGFADVR